MSLQPIMEDAAKSIDNDIWYPPILVCLAIPDVCGAIDAKETKNAARYDRWYDENVKPHFPDSDLIRFDGAVVRKFRNSLIHEATAYDKNTYGYDRIAFTTSRSSVQVQFALTSHSAGLGETLLMVSGLLFFKAVGRAVARWEAGVLAEANGDRRDRMNRIARLHPTGIWPHVGGTRLIG